MSATIANMDVAGLGDRLAAFAEEMCTCQSAGQVEWNSHDQGRARTYMEYIRSYLEVLTKPNDPLDLPRSHPGSFPVRPFVPAERVELIENVAVKDIVRRFQAGYQELLGSQSKDRSTGLTGPDKVRMLALIENTLGIIEFGTSGLDLPENPSEKGPTPPLR